MKKIGRYTTRGIVATADLPGADGPHRIQLWDGRFDTGYRITKFVLAVSNRDDSNLHICSGKLMTEPEDNNRYWNWSKNTQIAWASCSWDANDRYANAFESYVDPDNMVIEDLFIGIVASGDEGTEINYMIEMDKYDISEWQGALSMVRNRAQGST